MYNFVLVGPHKGKTIKLGGHQFVDGVFALQANADGVAPSLEDARKKGVLLAKLYQAFPEDSAELKDAAAAIKAGKPVKDDELDVAAREAEEQAKRDALGSESEKGAATTERKGAVRTALVKLDAGNDGHWMSGGLPSVEAVRELSGNKDVSRQDIVALAPNLTREEAAKIAAEAKDPLD